MVEKLNIVQSTIEPDKRNIWLKDGKLKKFGAKGWSTIGDSNAGGGTSTDKDALTIYIDTSTYNIIVNDKVYVTSQGGSDRLELTITDKELYNILYNSLINTYRTVYLRSSTINKTYLFGTCTGGFIYESGVILLFLTGVDMIIITVYNQ